MPTSSEKVSVIARLRAEPGKRDDLVAVFEAYVNDTVANEEGTESYTLFLDEADADVLWIHEVYANRAAIDAHMGNPAFMELLGNLAGIATADTQLNTVVPVASKGLTL